MDANGRREGSLHGNHSEPMEGVDYRNRADTIARLSQLYMPRETSGPLIFAAAQVKTGPIDTATQS